MSGTYVGAIDHESMESDTLDDAMIQIEEESVDDLILQPSLDGALSALMVEDIVDNHSEEEPILPYMRLLYLRSEHILKIARTLRIYSVSTVYIARQTLRLVLQLNKTIRADGLNDERRRERNILEEELISLEREIENYGNDLIVEKELLAQDEYDHWGKRMEVLYDIFFKTRSYFSNAQEPSKDEVFPKLLLYDRKTAALMNHPSFNLLDILDERYSAAAGSNGEEQSVGQLHTLLDGFQPPSDSETCTESQTVHAPEVIPLSNPFEDYGGRDLLVCCTSAEGLSLAANNRQRGKPLPLPHLQTAFPQRPQFDTRNHGFIAGCFLHLKWKNAESLRTCLLSVFRSQWWELNTAPRLGERSLRCFVRNQRCLFCNHRYQSFDQAMDCVCQHINYRPR